MGFANSDPILSSAVSTVGHSYPLTHFKALVSPGQRVREGDAIAVRNVPAALSVVSINGAKKRNGSTAPGFGNGVSVTQGEVLSSGAGHFGFGQRQVIAPVSGVVEAFIEDPGLLIIRPEAREDRVVARFAATVTAVGRTSIEVEVTGHTIRAALGAGPEVAGTLGVVDEAGSISDTLRTIVDVGDVSPPGILAFQQPIDSRIMRLVSEAYWRPDQVAVIGPTMPYEDFVKLDESFPGITVVIVGGFGTSAFGDKETDPIWRAIVDNRGLEAIVIPRSADGTARLVFPSSEFSSPAGPAELRPGLEVRFLQGFEFMRGTVVEVPEGQRFLQSGYRSTVVVVATEKGRVQTVARANVEVLAGSAVDVSPRP